jgi:glycosyltransferase involved in cell wall biosynthesis
MKITILTVCYNNQETILATLNSVLNQTYKNIEHIIVDGKSTDKTKIFLKKYPNKNKKIFYLKRKGVYNALNYGIKKATGDILHILHGDDIYNSPNVISNIIKIAKKRKKEKIFSTDIVYFNNNNYTSITRFFGAKKFTNTKIYLGLMPPHTGLFYKKNIYKKFLYDQTYKIAGDFEYLLKIILKKNNFFYTNLISVRMRTGGLSTKNIFSYVTTTLEIIKAFKKYKLNSSILRPLLRIPEKITQLIFFNKDNMNKDFQLKYSEFFKKNFKYDFFIQKKLNYSDFSKNFIYSAMNLAFLGNFANNSIKKNKHLIHWPDGIFSKNICDINIKIPGREILRNLEIPTNITNITVIGNLSNNAKLYLEDLYKKRVKNINLPYGNIQKIIKNFKHKTSKSELIFITLPTPKQEMLADYISKRNKYFKVICIGGSIAIACGDEKEVPSIFYSFEFLWRLKYETKRRFVRLISSLFNYFYGRYINKSLSNLKIVYEV